MNRLNIKGNLLGIEVELERQVVGAVLVKDIVLITIRAIRIAPALAPSMVSSNLVIQGVGNIGNLNVLLNQLVPTIGLIQGHVILSERNIPHLAKDGCFVSGNSE